MHICIAMAEIRKWDNRSESDNQTSVEDIRTHYPEFSRLLRKRQSEILPQQDVVRHNLEEQIQSSPGDDADASVIDTSADYFLKLANNQQAELGEIRDAIERMDRGTYGICEACEETIATDRLRKLPYAKHCIDCQSALERGKLTLVAKPYPKL